MALVPSLAPQQPLKLAWSILNSRGSSPYRPVFQYSEMFPIIYFKPSQGPPSQTLEISPKTFAKDSEISQMQQSYRNERIEHLKSSDIGLPSPGLGLSTRIETKRGQLLVWITLTEQITLP